MAVLSVDEYVKKYEGKPVEAGGSSNALNQCVDNANQYLVEVENRPKVLGANAVDFPTRIGPDFEFIANTPTGVPEKGDLVIWGKPYGKYIDSTGKTVYAGHIGIFLNGNATSFNSFDQNWKVGDPCKIVTHVNYDGVIGWLHLKPSDTLTITKVDFERIRGNSEKWDKTVAQLELGTDPATTPYESAQAVIGGLKSRAKDLQNQLTEAQADEANAHDHVSRLEAQLLSEEKAHKDGLDNLNKQLKLAQDAQGSAEARQKELQTQVDEASKAKGEALKALATSQNEVKLWKDKYDELLANKAKVLSLRDRLVILFSGKI